MAAHAIPCNDTSVPTIEEVITGLANKINWLVGPRNPNICGLEYQVVLDLRRITYAESLKEVDAKYQEILDKALNLQVSDNLDRTALIWAAEHSRRDLAFLLLNLRASPDTMDSRGNTALMYTAMNDACEIALKLIECDCDQSLTNEKGQTAKDIAEAHGFVNWPHPSSGRLDLPPSSALEDALAAVVTKLSRLRRSKNPRKSALALKKAIDDYTEVFQDAAKDVAKDEIEKKFKEALQKAIGLDEERTPLMWAIEHHQNGLAKLLKDSGANVNLTDRYGQNALMFAAMSKLAVGATNFESVPMLIKAGCYVNAKDAWGSTALYYFATPELCNPTQTQATEIINQFMDAKLKPVFTSQNIYGSTALTAMAAGASRSNNLFMLKALLAKMKGNMHLLGLDLQDVYGDTALMFTASFSAATGNDGLQVARDLIAGGANKDLTNKAGQTAQAIAAANGYPHWPDNWHKK